MSHRPYVFIGSSSEGKKVAEAIQANLVEVCESRVWDQGVFIVGSNTLESLVSQLDKLDFAVLVLSADDFITSRGEHTLAPRDNVLIEIGLFIGSLGRHRTFVVYDSESNVKIPSDLAGVTLAKYQAPVMACWQSAVAPACLAIRQEITRNGFRCNPSTQISMPVAPPLDIKAARNEIKQRISDNPDILGAKDGPPSLDLWYNDLSPLVYQSMSYTTPTYYVDTSLNIIDWNIAFELIFADITPKLRYRHVNEFIARLINYSDVFDHGREFTNRIMAGELPFVDTEILLYRSARYGDITLAKVATPLHDTSGKICGWSVALFLKNIDWNLLVPDFERRIREDRMWSQYSYSYDKILTVFPPYQQLLEEVASVIPDSAIKVADIGSGTGNSSEVLLKRGFIVTSIESNPEMIRRMREKNFDKTKHKIIKASAEALGSLPKTETGLFDGAILVNVLYSLDDPEKCLKGVNRLLNTNGFLGLSTTHRDVKLDPLLDSIKKNIEKLGRFDELRDDYEHIHEINKRIERDIARRHSADDYVKMVEGAGFEILSCKNYTYEGAVMIIHARKKSDSV